MNRTTLPCLAVAAVALLFSGASLAQAQPTFFVISVSRPGGAVRPAKLPPTYVGQLGFSHWDLREFPNCGVPFHIHAAATADTTTTVANARTAINTAFTSWNNAAPAVFAYNNLGNWASPEPQPAAGACAQDPAPGIGAPANRAVQPRRDCRNLVMWSNGATPLERRFIGAPGSATLAATLNYHDGRGRIQEFDMVFNDRDYQWNTTGNTAGQLSSQAGPNANNTFPLANGDTLTLSINGAAAITVTFLAGNFANIAQATPAEVATVINTRLGVLGITNATAVGVAAPAGLPATFHNRVHILNLTTPMNGNATLQVTGGTANAAAKLAFPGAALIVNGMDIESIAVHEAGHALGLDHSSELNPEPNAGRNNAIMYFQAPLAGVKRALTAIDTAGINFLYTPDLGDAPDPAAGTFNQYQTLVHGNAIGRLLNGQQLTTLGLGPEHLFGNSGPNRFEWLGADEDGSANECEARVPDNDNFDDGVTIFPAPPLVRGQTNHVRVKMKFNTLADRYSLANNDDVLLALPGGAALPNCGDRVPPPAPTVANPNPAAPVNVPYIGPGPNGVINTTPNNCNTSGGDDQIVNIPNPGVPPPAMIPAITTGANGLVETVLPEANLNANPARRILYINGYADLNANNLFDPAERLMFFSDIPNATLGPAPAARSLNFRSVSINGFVNETEVAFDLFVPRTAPANLRFRFRLDLGEDEGRVALPGGLGNGWDGTLAPATGAAQFGEVEDYVFPTQAGPPVPDQLHIRGPYLVPIRPLNSPNQPSILDAWVENNFVGVPLQEVRFEVLSGNAKFLGLNAAPNGLTASRVSGNVGGNPQAAGLVTASLDGTAAGDGLIKVSVTDSPLVAYYVFKIPAARVIGDTTGDSTVAFDDIPMILANWGRDGMPNVAGDANEDGLVNFADITSVLSNFGAAAP